MYQWVITIVITGVLAWCGLTVAYEAGVTAGRTKAQAECNAKAFYAERAARAREQQLLAENRKIEERYAQYQRTSAAAAASARSELERLRDTLASRRATPVAAPAQPLPDGAGDTERQILAQCATEVQGLAAEADRLADKVTGLQDYVKTVLMFVDDSTIPKPTNNLE